MHHVHGMPIDYDARSYGAARERAGGTDERLAEAYFDAQFDMVRALRPVVVGHFDLVRLLSAEREGRFRRWPGVWERVERNLREVVAYGGLVEVNAAGLRKGLREPYPGRDICRVSFLRVAGVGELRGVGCGLQCADVSSWQAFLEMGGRFTLSDDSHGVEQVGTNYERVLQFVEETGIKEVHFLERGGVAFDQRFPNVSMSSVSLAELKRHAFWRVGRSNDALPEGSPKAD